MRNKNQKRRIESYKLNDEVCSIIRAVADVEGICDTEAASRIIYQWRDYSRKAALEVKTEADTSNTLEEKLEALEDRLDRLMRKLEITRL